MPRISGVEIPKHKGEEIALTYLFGIGKKRANKILETAKIDLNKKAGEWTDNESSTIRKIIAQDYNVEGGLRAEIRLNIKRLKDIGCYRGIRHRIGLPVHGQNTKNNARTRKGRGKPIANKKK